MKDKKILMLMIAFSLCFFAGNHIAICDDESAPSDFNSTYTDEPDENIGAWYDEVWEATGFYSTGDPTYQAGSGWGASEEWELKYSYTSEPEGETVWENGVGLPSDSVVVEWKTSGHVHFASGL